MDTNEGIMININLNNTETSNLKNHKWDKTSSSMDKLLCKSSASIFGYCVPYFECDCSTLRTRQSNDLTNNESFQGCAHYLDVCCPFDLIMTENEVNGMETETNPVSFNFESRTGESSSNVCGLSRPIQTSEEHNIESINGKYAQFGEFPWMVAIMKLHLEDDGVWKQNDYIGGGTIVHPSVVITAAHLVNKFSYTLIKCRGGEYDTQNTSDMYPYQDRHVKKISLHPEFSRVTAKNDVALIFLKDPFNLAIAPHMGVACLGSQLPQQRTGCLSMGWGKDTTQNKNASVLKKVSLDLVDHYMCQSSLRSKRLGPRFILDPTLICAESEGVTNTCHGDSGTSLICPIEESNGLKRYAVYGMVVYSLECGQRNTPGIYVNIPLVYNWINEEMKKEQLDMLYAI